MRDRWGNLIPFSEFPKDNQPFRIGRFWYVKVWMYPAKGWSRPHGCKINGTAWGLLCPELKAAHPGGKEGIMGVETMYGWGP